MTTKQRLLTLLEIVLVISLFQLLGRGIFRVFVNLGWFTPEDGKTVTVIFILTSISLVFVLATMFASSRLWKFSFAQYGIRWRDFPNLKVFGKLILLSAVGQGIIALIGEGLEHLSGQVSTVPQVPDIKTLAVALLLSFIGGGIREELFYRGYLITRIPKIFTNERTGKIVAIVFQITLFGWSHHYQGPIGVTQTTLGALLFTWVYLSSGNLWHSIIVHSFYDVWGFALIFLWH